jgi:hypothetical protein
MAIYMSFCHAESQTLGRVDLIRVYVALKCSERKIKHGVSSFVLHVASH